ncbi:TIGR03435 family protein [Pseudoflavitalea sp. X16]|uniref:TIGR03435 family protein n=1 Tax=Paraflavitalea devenefica TaxID=2716334 RepID=UPI00141E9BFB|nr:TIGR03435 family protein [Paraflavitalea devenefica]NII29513.1 TIGR03435 family protein [Paraflavitalea devenefica]
MQLKNISPGRIISLLFLFFSSPVWAQQATIQAPAVGEKAPGLQLSEVVQGPALNTISLEKLKGKIVVLEFWTTWCGPCVAAFPHINELVEKYKDKPVVFIAVTTDDNKVLMSSLKEKATRVLHNRPLNTWVVVDAEGALTRNRYKIAAYPTTVLINQEGNLDAVTRPFSLKEAALNNLLAGKPSGLAKPPGSAMPSSPAVVEKDKTVPVFSVSLKKQSKRGGLSTSSNRNYFVESASATDVLKWAFNINPLRIVFKDSLPDDRWTIEANYPPGQESLAKEYFRKMIPLGWGITITAGKQEIEVYVMKYNKVPQKKNKSCLTPADTLLRGGHLSTSDGTALATHWEFSGIVAHCQGLLNRLIIDETNLQGYYDLSLFYQEGDAVSVVEALKDCGLMLTKEKRMMDVLWVSRTPVH